jgi:hypothetical protein
MSDHYDPEMSKRARDAGIARVLSLNSTWADNLGAWIISLPHGWTGTGEEIRRIYRECGGQLPKHHNAWGGVINGMVRRGVLVRTGKRKHMIASKSHSRTTDVYVRA